MSYMNQELNRHFHHVSVSSIKPHFGSTSVELTYSTCNNMYCVAEFTMRWLEIPLNY